MHTTNSRQAPRLYGHTGIDTIDSDSDDAPRYDINGHPAGPSHNGIVIKKGRKTLNIAR